MHVPFRMICTSSYVALGHLVKVIEREAGAQVAF
jgi:hypothetical protein